MSSSSRLLRSTRPRCPIWHPIPWRSSSRLPSGLHCSAASRPCWIQKWRSNVWHVQFGETVMLYFCEPSSGCHCVCYISCHVQLLWQYDSWPDTASTALLYAMPRVILLKSNRSTRQPAIERCRVPYHSAKVQRSCSVACARLEMFHPNFQRHTFSQVAEAVEIFMAILAN